MSARKKHHAQPNRPQLTQFAMRLPPVILLTVLVALAVGAGHLARAGKTSARQLSRLSGDISVHATGRGNPRINLSNGREVLTAYSGPAALAQALQDNKAEPLALTSADFDEDGVPDLICGYAHASAGIITWLRGNVDSIYENSPEAQQRKATGEFTDAPFLSPASVFDVPAPVEFIGAGDFDADDHWDLVAAARGSDKLYLLSGDGRGGFAPAKSLGLPGAVTALVTGDINRRDGLEDVIVAVNGQGGTKLMVFEGSEGALKARPEFFDLPAEAIALALGQLDDHYSIDIAVAAGRNLIVVRGRDRSEAVAELRHAPAPPATVSRRSFPFAIKSLAIGDFTAGHAPSMALLSEDGVVHLLRIADVNAQAPARENVASWIELNSVSLPGESRHDISGSLCQILAARVSSLPTDDLVIVDSATGQVQIATGESIQPDTRPGFQREMTSLGVEGKPVAALPMRLNADALSDLVILRSGNSAPLVVATAAAMTFTVTNIGDNGGVDPIPFASTGTLRQAIIDANANPGADKIVFSIPAKAPFAPFTITPQSPMPEITDPVTIDGYTQKGSSSNTRADGDNAVLMIVLNGSRVQGMPSDESCGTTNRFSVGPLPAGLHISSGKSKVTGLVVNNFAGTEVFIDGNGDDIIEGNFIGTDSEGNNSFVHNDPLGYGVRVGLKEDATGSPNNIIGGATPQARNLISGNSIGIFILGKGSNNNSIQGNYIGTNAGGTEPLGNFYEGMDIKGRVCLDAVETQNNTVGGKEPGARNLISGNGFLGGGSPGLAITGPGATGNFVQGNYFGTNFDGTKATNLDGTKKMGNASEGVLINLSAAANMIGGTTVAARNVISGNLHNGVVIGSEGSAPVSDNFVQGNFIGTDSSGTIGLGNARNGVIISEAGNPSMIMNNVISANSQNGVSIGGFFEDPAVPGSKLFGGKGTHVEENKIGTDASGAKDLGNMCHGIYVENNSFIHTIKNNVIAFNKKNGISIPNKAGQDVEVAEGEKTAPGKQVRISRNSIFSNELPGIDLGETGVNANHPKDPDNLEANEGQNFPEFNVTNDGTNITVQGKLEKSAPDTFFTIEFFNNSPESVAGLRAAASGDCIRQGQVFLGSIKVKTDSSGKAPISFVLPRSAPGGFINSTATTLDGNTSEFSACVQTGPTILAITVQSELIAEGSGFKEPVQVFIDDMPFSEDAKLRRGRRLIQRGGIIQGGQTITIGQAIPPGKLVRIKFRNQDGGETEVSFRN